MPQQNLRSLEEVVLGAQKQSPMVTEMLDEIARLRAALRVKHTDTCSVMRTSSTCDCGWWGRDASRVAEINELRATLLLRDQEIEYHKREITRLDIERLRVGASASALMQPRRPRFAKATPGVSGFQERAEEEIINAGKSRRKRTSANASRSRAGSEPVRAAAVSTRR